MLDLDQSSFRPIKDVHVFGESSWKLSFKAGDGLFNYLK